MSAEFINALHEAVESKDIGIVLITSPFSLRPSCIRVKLSQPSLVEIPDRHAWENQMIYNKICPKPSALKYEVV